MYAHRENGTKTWYFEYVIRRGHKSVNVKQVNVTIDYKWLDLDIFQIECLLVYVWMCKNVRSHAHAHSCAYSNRSKCNAKLLDNKWKSLFYFGQHTHFGYTYTHSLHNKSFHFKPINLTSWFLATPVALRNSFIFHAFNQKTFSKFFIFNIHVRYEEFGTHLPSSNLIEEFK